MIDWFISWLNGLKVGDIQYTKASPYIVCDFFGFLPKDCHTDDEKASVKYRCTKRIWSGCRWDFVDTLELTMEGWKEEYEQTRTRLGSRM